MDLIKNCGQLVDYAGDSTAGVICKSLERAVNAVHPSYCVGRYLATDAGARFASSLRGADSVCAGGGKASAQMAVALTEAGILPNHGQINCSIEGKIGGVVLKKCSHPLPDDSTVKKTDDCIGMLLDSDDSAHIVFLLSGGASSMLSSPADFAGLERKRAISERMMLAGASISEVNCVRRHLSKIKGGKLSRMSHPRRVTTLIISDIVGNRLEDIGSGPTSHDPTTSRDALALMRKYGTIELIAGLEEAFLSPVNETVKQGSPALSMTTNTIIADSSTAVASAVEAASAGGHNAVASGISLTGEADSEAVSFVENARKKLNGPGMFVAGGEVLVRVGRKGDGGRCQHFALLCAKHLRKGEYVAAFATDGKDGNTAAAGGLVSAADDGQDYLDSFESGRYFAMNHTAIYTGDTGTNVADVYIYFRKNNQ